MNPRSKQDSRSSGRSLQRDNSVTELHPAVVNIALAATSLGLFCIWLTFSWNLEIGYLLAVVSAFSLIFFATLLISLSHIIGDSRWRQQHASFARFLKKQVAVHGGRISGREALLQITLLPVALTFAFAAIGLIWNLLH